MAQSFEIQQPQKPKEKVDLKMFTWLPFEKAFVCLWLAYTFIKLCIDFAIYNNDLKKKYNIKGVESGYLQIVGLDKKDVNDFQWSKFNENLPLYFIAFLIFLGIGYFIKSQKFNAQFKYKPIALFYAIFGLGSFTYLFFADILFVLFFTGLNYLLTILFVRKKFFPALIWSMHILNLYGMDRCHGYKFTYFHSSFQFLDDLRNEAPLQWNILFNMSILKMISFSMDYHWSMTNQYQFREQEHQQKCQLCTKPNTEEEKQKFINEENKQENEPKIHQKVQCLKSRSYKHQPETSFNLIYYFGYLFYFPTFITGPIITYNGWISQVFQKQNTYSNKQVWSYFFRVIASYLGFELFQHIFCVNAVSTNHENAYIWKSMSSYYLLVMGFFELLFLWFKFLLIWRIPRSWALFDGIETPENMNRCVCNNYCFEEFWRSWHRGFNQWLIRYIFIPLGGSAKKQYNIWVVFSFVAIWHDFKLNLIIWAWGICVALMPEIIIKWYFSRSKYHYLWSKVWWKYVCAIGAAVDVYLMIFANLVGFGFGYEGLLLIIQEFLTGAGALVFLKGIVVFFIGAQVLFYIREIEPDHDKGF